LGKAVGIISFDLSAAFDTVSLHSLRKALITIGIHGIELAWFSDYMTSGFQKVCWNGSYSVWKEVCFGVRQGLILGPLLFLIVVRDSAVALSELMEAYADDSLAWASAETEEEVAEILTLRAADFVKYTQERGLTLNASKTQLLYLSKRQGPAIKVENDWIEPSPELDLLGTTFQSDLSFNKHNKSVGKDLRSRAGLINRLSYHVPRGPILNQLYSGIYLGKLNCDLAITSKLSQGSTSLTQTYPL
jgi:hypothetical protein